MAMTRLALKSLWNRRTTALLTFVAITLSVALLLSVDRVRGDAHTSFANTISQTDLIVGARSGSMQLLLYSVFRMGSPTSTVDWSSYQHIADHDAVAWTVPLMLGDAYRGYPVLGTTADYFERYRYARDERLALASGTRFDDRHGAVLGARVAEELDHRLGDSIVVSHGGGEISFRDHDDRPFTVVGILEPTGTPVDRTVHITLAGFESLHSEWPGGNGGHDHGHDHEDDHEPHRTADEPHRAGHPAPDTITAALVGLHSPRDTFTVQRHVNTYREEPLMAIIPGVALQELWDLMAVAERALLAISAFVVLVGLIGMTTALLAGLNERRREMAILRASGARPHQIFTLLVSEAAALATAGAAAGLALLYLGLWLLRPWVATEYGLFLEMAPPSSREWALLGGVVGAGFLLGALPAWRAYRHSIADGLTVRL